MKDPKARHEPKRGTETSPFTKNSEGETPVKTQETVEYFDSMEEAQQKYNSGEFSGFVEDREEETYGIGAWPARWRKTGRAKAPACTSGGTASGLEYACCDAISWHTAKHSDVSSFSRRSSASGRGGAQSPSAHWAFLGHKFSA